MRFLVLLVFAFLNCLSGVLGAEQEEKNEGFFFRTCSIALDLPSILPMLQKGVDDLVIAQIEPDKTSGAEVMKLLEPDKPLTSAAVPQGIRYSGTYKILRSVGNKIQDEKINRNIPFDWLGSPHSVAWHRGTQPLQECIEELRNPFAQTQAPPRTVLCKLKDHKEKNESPFSEFIHLPDEIKTAEAAYAWLSDSHKIEKDLTTEDKLRQALTNKNIFVSSFAAEQLLRKNLWNDKDWAWLVKDAPELLRTCVVLHASLPEGNAPEFVAKFLAEATSFRDIRAVLSGLILANGLANHGALDGGTFKLLESINKKFKAEVEVDREWLIVSKAYGIRP